MRVKIGPYKNWLGPYHIADSIPFLSEDTKDKIGDWLARKQWVNNLCWWIDRMKGERKIKVHIDKYDTWNMDETLSYIILPMLKQLRDTKHGSPIVDDEDVPEHMRYSDANEYGCGGNWVHYKWEWVLNEMIWAFEQHLNEDNWDEMFNHGEPEFKEIENEDGTFSIEQTNPDYRYDFEGYKAHQLRVSNGFRLFGKYYQNLWD